MAFFTKLLPNDVWFTKSHYLTVCNWSKKGNNSGLQWILFLDCRAGSHYRNRGCQNDRCIPRERILLSNYAQEIRSCLWNIYNPECIRWEPFKSRLDVCIVCVHQRASIREHEFIGRWCCLDLSSLEDVFSFLQGKGLRYSGSWTGQVYWYLLRIIHIIPGNFCSPCTGTWYVYSAFIFCWDPKG